MSTPTDRTARRRDRRKAEMIDAALALLSAHGYHGMRFEDVADRADIAKASLYYYFPSKDDLVAQALAKLTDSVVDRLNTALAAVVDESATVRFRVLVDTQLDILTVDYPEVGAIFAFPAPWPADHAATIKAMRRTHDAIFRDVVDAGVAAGEFTTADPAVALHCLHGTLNHASLWLRTEADTDRQQRDAVIDAALRLFR